MRANVRHLGAAAVVAVSIAACSFAPSTPALYEDGAATYHAACASCHGQDGRGRGPGAASLRPLPTDLTTLSQRNRGRFPRAQVLAVVTGEADIAAHGERQMPVWSQHFAPSNQGATAAASIYARRQLDALVDYIATLQRAGE